MKIALISDIHGNAVALRAVMRKLSERVVDRVVCLGDLVTYGPDPIGVMNILHEAESENVLGNMDAWAVDPKPLHLDHPHAHKIADIHSWSVAKLGKSEHDVLRQLPSTILLSLDVCTTLLSCHGSPRCVDEPILSTTPEEYLSEAVGGVSARVVACGHTHSQMLRCHDGKMIINPGSVGYPPCGTDSSRDPHYPSWAEYAVINSEHGLLDVEFTRAMYDVGELIQSAVVVDMPHWEWWCRLWMSSSEEGHSR